MTNQELADAIQKHVQAAIGLATQAQGRACKAAEHDDKITPVVAESADGLGHLWQAHAALTRAGAAMPDVTLKFGGDK